MKWKNNCKIKKNILSDCFDWTRRANETLTTYIVFEKKKNTNKKMRIIIINVKKKRKENETKCCVQPGAADGTRLSEIHFTFCVYAPDVTHTHICIYIMT